jgi:hypothetical protein
MVDVSIWQTSWWGDCVNTLGEEVKQLKYAERIGLIRTETRRSPFIFDMLGASVIDIGGGPVSLLLKCINFSSGVVIDAGTDYPYWVYERYQSAGIRYVIEVGENLNVVGHDEAWLINALQHTVNPEQVLRNARKAANLVRVFEWTNTISTESSPHILTKGFLDQVLDVRGTVETINLFGYVGHGYSAVAPGM